MSTYPPFMPGLPGITLFNDFSGLYRPTASNADLDRLYSTSVAIYAAANFWGSTASLTRWKVLDANKQEVSPNEPEVRALRFNMPDILHRSMISEKFRGYNLLYKERNMVSRRVHALRWMNFNMYQLDENFQTGLRGFRVMQNGTNYEPIQVDYIERPDGIYWNLIDLQDDFDGVAAAEVAFMYAGVDVEAGTTMLSFFQNMAIPAMVVQPAADGKLAPSQEQAETLTTLLRKVVRGAMNFGRTIVTPARWEFQQLQSHMEDLKMGELIATARESVRVAMDVPKFVISSDGTSYAESYEERRQWLNLSFVPHMHKIGRSFEDQLIRPMHPDWTVEPDFSHVPGMKEEAERLTTTIMAQVNGGTRTLFSAQEELGIEPEPLLKRIVMIQGVPVPVEEVPNFYKNMQAQGGLMGAMPPAPGFGGGAPADTPISTGDNAQGAAPSMPVGSGAKESGTKSAAVMLGIGAHPDLIGLQNQVKSLAQGQTVEWNAPDTFHVTLAAFPALDDAQLAMLRQYVMQMQAPPVSLRIGSLGTFDNLGQYAIRFMIRQPAELTKLKEALCAYCEENNIPVGHHYAAGQTYKPHITMGYSDVNPGRLTYSTTLAVQPKTVQFGVDDTIAYERPLNAPSMKSVDDPETGDEVWLDDAEYKELKQWRILKARKGIDYAFAPNLLPADSIAYADGLLSGGYTVEDAADALKVHVISGKKKLTTPDGEIVAYDAWQDYDRLEAAIGNAWLDDYQSVVLKDILSQVDENGLSVAALDRAFEQSQDSLVDAWTGTPEAPGALSQLIMAGVAAGDASLKQGSAANPNRPVALKAVEVGVNWNLANLDAVEFIKRYSLNLIARLNDTTRSEVQRVIAEWLLDGGTMSDLTRALSAVVRSPVRAAMIAETESTRAYFEGAKERYRQAEVKKIEWRTVNVGLKRSVKKPGDVCDVCTPLHGKTGDLDKGVWSDKEQRYMTPPAHVRCRCWAVPADEDML